MESQPQNPEFRINPENVQPCEPTVKHLHKKIPVRLYPLFPILTFSHLVKVRGNIPSIDLVPWTVHASEK